MSKQSSSIKQKAVLLLAIPFVLQLTLLSEIFNYHQDVVTAQFWVNHSGEVIERIDLLHRRLLEQQSSARALILTKDRRFEESFRLAADETRKNLEQLKGLVAGEPGPLQHTLDLEGDIDNFQKRLAKKVTLATAGKIAEAITMMRDMADHRYIEALANKLEVFRHQQKALEALRAANLTKENQGIFWLLVLAVIIQGLCTFAVIVLFDRGINARVQLILQNLSLLSNNRPLLQPAHQGKGDELARLDWSVFTTCRTLQQRTEEIEMFIHSASHDLRSPLVNLEGFTDELRWSLDQLQTILRLEFPQNENQPQVFRILESDLPESINFIKAATARLSVIINALLRLSRVGRVEYQWGPVDLNVLLARISASLQNALDRHDAVIEIGTLPQVYGDAVALEQAIGNLIDNAIKYLHPERAGRISIGEEQTQSPPGMVTIYVRDNGLGIPEEQQAKLFTIFHRLHPEVASGEGVGLALTRKIAERHGGKIWAVSEAGVGSVFFLTLPSSNPQNVVTPASADSPGTASDEHRELV